MRRIRKTVSVGADLTSGGRLFQKRLPATGNARSPTVDSRVRRITSCEDDDDRRAAVGIGDALDVVCSRDQSPTDKPTKLYPCNVSHRQNSDVIIILFRHRPSVPVCRDIQKHSSSNLTPQALLYSHGTILPVFSYTYMYCINTTLHLGYFCPAYCADLLR